MATSINEIDEVRAEIIMQNILPRTYYPKKQFSQFDLDEIFRDHFKLYLKALDKRINLHILQGSKLIDLYIKCVIFIHNI